MTYIHSFPPSRWLFHQSPWPCHLKMRLSITSMVRVLFKQVWTTFWQAKPWTDSPCKSQVAKIAPWHPEASSRISWKPWSTPSVEWAAPSNQSGIKRTLLRQRISAAAAASKFEFKIRQGTALINGSLKKAPVQSKAAGRSVMAWHQYNIYSVLLLADAWTRHLWQGVFF